MKNQMTRKSVLAIAALVLCLSVSVGGAMAYFTDYEDASGGAILNLGGETEIDEGSDSRNKHIVIENTGETNMIVRVAILGNESEKYMTVTPASGWTPSDENGIRYYYYNTVLEPGKTTTAIDAVLKTEWQKGEDHPDLEKMQITVRHESAQAIYDVDSKKLATPDGWNAGIVSEIPPSSLASEEAAS